MSPEIEFIDVPGHHFGLDEKTPVAAILGRARARLDALDASNGESAGAV